MSKKAELREEKQASPYFEGQSPTTITGGTREQQNIPYVISGGEVTEYYYFKHISKITEYSLNIEPEYFKGESGYDKEFPERISKILKALPDVKIYCVFDLDVPSGLQGNNNQDKEKEKYTQFKEEIAEWVQKGNVVLALSRPSFEYWLLLHFKTFNATSDIHGKQNINGLLGTTPLRNSLLKPKIKNIKRKTYAQDKAWVDCLCSHGRLKHAILQGKDSVQNMDNPDELLCSTNFSAVYRVFEEHPNHKS